MHGNLDALEDFIDKRENLDSEVLIDESQSVVIPMDDMTHILVQLWKSRHEPKIGELYEKYKELIPAE